MKIAGWERRVLSTPFIIAVFVLIAVAALSTAIVLPQKLSEEKADAEYALSPPDSTSFTMISQTTKLEEKGINIIYVVHDDERNVTCYVVATSTDTRYHTRGIGISCLRDEDTLKYSSSLK